MYHGSLIMSEITIGQNYLHIISGLMALCSLLRKVWKMA